MFWLATGKTPKGLGKWLPWVDACRSADDSRAFINATRKQYSDNDGVQAGIWFQDGIVGIIGQHKIDWLNKATSLGYWLAEEHQGRGIMTKSCQAFIQYSFHGLKLNRVEIRCATENSQSKAIAQRLGFKREGILRSAEWLYDHYVDHEVYGLLANEWTYE